MRFFKKFFVLLTITALSFNLCACDKLLGNSSLIKINLSSLTLNTAYAPLIIAVNNNYFKDEGLDVNISYSDSSESVINNVMSEGFDIGMAQSEYTASLYIDNKENLPVYFATTDNTNSNYLIIREKSDKLTSSDLKGKTIISYSINDFNNLALKTILTKKKINIGSDVNMINNLESSYITTAYESGTGDLALMSLESALSIEKNDNGKILLSLGKELGNYQNTSFIAKESFIKNNPEIIQKFTNAIYKAQIYINTHPASQIAKVIAPSFSDVEYSVIEKSVEEFKNNNFWTKNPIVTEKNYNNMIKIASNSSNKFKKNTPTYEDICDNTFAEEAIKNIR